MFYIIYIHHYIMIYNVLFTAHPNLQDYSPGLCQNIITIEVPWLMSTESIRFCDEWVMYLICKIKCIIWKALQMMLGLNMRFGDLLLVYLGVCVLVPSSSTRESIYMIVHMSLSGLHIEFSEICTFLQTIAGHPPLLKP